MYLLPAVNVDDSSSVSEPSVVLQKTAPPAPPASGYSIAHLMETQMQDEADTGKKELFFANIFQL